MRSVVSEVNESLKEQNVRISHHSKNVIRKHLGNKALHLNTYGVARLAMNFIVTIRKF